MMDATYFENEPDLINQIEDMLMEELYENNRGNSKPQITLNEKFQEIGRDGVIDQINAFSLLDDQHDGKFKLFSGS